MKNNNSSIAIFTGLGHGVFHGFELVIPLFVPIWLSMFDVSATTLGLVVGAGYALIGLFAPSRVCWRTSTDRNGSYYSLLVAWVSRSPR